MTVRELIKCLLVAPSDALVILQRDPEGNGYSPISGVDTDAIWRERDFEVLRTYWSADEVLLEEQEWEQIKKNGPYCVVLEPAY